MATHRFFTPLPSAPRLQRPVPCFLPPALYLCLALLIAPTVCRAGGYFLIPRGAVALGRGGALVAGAQDLTAAWLNPGRLATLDGVQVLADVGLIWWQVEFQRAADPEIAPNGFPRAENIAPMVASPSLFLGWDCNLDWLQVTLGFYGPYAGDLGFDSMGPQRYTLVYLDMFYAVYMAAVSFRPLRWLAFGASFQIQDIRMTEVVKMTAYTGFDGLGPPENPSDDIIVEVDVANHANLSGLLGLWIAPADWVDLGLAVQLPVRAALPGRASVQFPSDNALLRDAWVEGDQVTVHISSATIIRAGAAIRLPHRFELEVDVWAEIWEPHEEIRLEVHDIYIRDAEGDLDIQMNDQSVPQDWHSSFGVAAGAEWVALPDRLAVRLGAYYDSGAIPDHTVSVAWFDSHKIGLTLGLSVEVWHLAFDVAYSHVFFVPRTVTTSAVQQFNPIEPEDPELRTTVGNGRYESSSDVLAFSIRAAIPTRSRRTDQDEEETPAEAEDGRP